jgi:hypothetical protein
VAEPVPEDEPTAVTLAAPTPETVAEPEAEPVADTRIEVALILLRRLVVNHPCLKTPALRKWK